MGPVDQCQSELLAGFNGFTDRILLRGLAFRSEVTQVDEPGQWEWTSLVVGSPL